MNDRVDMARRELARRELARRAQNNPQQSEEKKNLLQRAGDFAERNINQPSASFAENFQQGIANIPIGAANLASKGINAVSSAHIPEIQAYDFAPHDAAGIAGSVASYLPGGGIIKAGGKALNLASEASGLSAKALENPIIRNLLMQSTRGSGLAGTAAQGALEGAIYNPNDQQTGGLLGAGGNLAGKALGTENKILKAIGRAAIGGTAGYAVGGKEGAEYGAGAGLLAPIALKKLGMGTGLAGRELLPYVDKNAIETAEAGKRLNTPLTIAESTGNPYVGKVEGGFGRTAEAAAEKTKIGMDRVLKQKSAINDLLDTIYDKSTASKQKIVDLYTAANKWNIKPSVVAEFKNDPVIAEAFKRVENDPAYQRKLKDVSPNNVAYLNQVKRALQDMEGSALRAGEKDRAAEFKAARGDLVDTIDSSVPAYKEARMEAQKSIVRSQLQKAMNNKEIKGTTFYNTILKNDDKFNQIVSSLKNVPEAQEKLRDMKKAWKDLINIETPRSAAGRSESNTSAARDTIQHIFDLVEEATGSKRNKEALAYIHGGEWHKDIDEISKLKSRKERSEKYIQILSKFPAAIYSGSNKDSS